MLWLKDVADYIAGLGLVEDGHVYVGKLDAKKQKSIGIYNRGSSGQPFTAVGGLECTSYGTKPVSLLVHWNRNAVETEQAAGSLFEKLRTASGVVIGNHPVDALRLMIPEPQSVGTDDEGIYEYVIWMDILYSRKEQ